MIEQIKGILLQGRCFAEEVYLPLFSKITDRIAVVYGKRGSGKTTLAQAFASVAPFGSPVADITARLIGRAGEELHLPEQAAVRVFDEAHMDHILRVEPSGRATAVRLGGFPPHADKYEAVEQINRALSGFFSEQGKLSLVIRRGKCVLCREGVPLLPDQLTTTELQVLGLCSFFTGVAFIPHEEVPYAADELVVIDLPAMELDTPSKTELAAYIGYQIIRLMVENTLCRVVILSRDLSTVFDLLDMAETLCHTTAQTGEWPALTFCGWELQHNGLQPFSRDKMSPADTVFL